MTDAIGRVAATFDRTVDVQWFRAPGRVNLIGDHTDYNGGFVLPLAIDSACVIAARRSDTVRVRSLDTSGVVELPADGAVDPSSVMPAWGRYVAAVTRELGELGRPAVGMDAVLASDVPVGAGLSSSAALEVVCAVALAALADWDPGALALAEACRRAEEQAVGVPCGIMDQLISVAGRDGHALLIDCRVLQWQAVPLPVGLEIVVVHSGQQRALADTAYGERRRSCEELAHRLGVPFLRDATWEQVADEPVGRHVVSENERVLEAVRALDADDAIRLGSLMSASHASLRDDYGVSTEELDVLVELLVGAGAFGARLTGAGFGGAVVAVCERGAAQRILDASLPEYRDRTGLEPRAYSCRAVDGAGPIDRGSPGRPHL